MFEPTQTCLKIFRAGKMLNLYTFSRNVGKSSFNRNSRYSVLYTKHLLPQENMIFNHGPQLFSKRKTPVRLERLVQTARCFTRMQTSIPSGPVRGPVVLKSPDLSLYEPPRHGLISYLPRSWVPYAELIRIDKPTGTYYLFFPCLFSTFIAASYVASPIELVLATSMYFFAGALIMRGAGCTINDLWDRNLDPYVTRTRHRPIARGAITPFNALLFAGIQGLTGLGVLVQFPTACLYYGIPSLLLVTTYPLAKRVTYYPQLVLGFTFSWGAIMGFPALGIDILEDSAALGAAGFLYASCIAWTVLYDMIYAHMDIKDDKKAGIKSIALRHEKGTKSVLSILAIIQVCLLAAAGVSTGASPVFFIGSCGSAATTLGLMIWKVKLKETGSCWWWFKNGAWFTGGGIATGLFADYLFKVHHTIAKDEDFVSSDNVVR